MDYDCAEDDKEEESQQESDSNFDPFAGVDLMEFDHTQCANCQGLFDWNNSFEPDKEPPRFCDRCEKQQFLCRCQDCGEKLTAWTAFPKGNSSWADSANSKSWCTMCYGKVLREQIIPDYRTSHSYDEYTMTENVAFIKKNFFSNKKLFFTKI